MALSKPKTDGLTHHGRGLAAFDGVYLKKSFTPQVRLYNATYSKLVLESSNCSLHDCSLEVV